MTDVTNRAPGRLGRPLLWGLCGMGIMLTGSGIALAIAMTSEGFGGAVAGGIGVLVALGLAILALWFYRSVILARWAKRAAPELAGRRALPGLLIGLASGIAFLLVSFGLIVALGGYEVRPSGGVGPAALFSVLVMVILSAVCEELAMRGCALQAVEQRFGWIAGLAASSVLFGVIHLVNPGATVWSAIAITLEAGLLIGAVFLLTRSLWVPIGLHAGWNLTESLLGVPVSGTEPHGFLQVTPVGADLLTGGAFGLEASIVPVVLGVAASCVLLVVALRRGRLSPVRVPWLSSTPDAQVA